MVSQTSTSTYTGSEGTVSQNVTVTVTAAQAPTLTTLSPNSAAAGGPAFTLTVNGNNFVSGSVVGSSTSRPYPQSVAPLEAVRAHESALRCSISRLHS
jgi:hypothetical protein